MAKTPLALVKESHGDKAKLVAAITKLATADLWLDRVNSEKGLGRISNAKLLRLQKALEDAKTRFGTRAKLVDAVAALEKRSKDEGYKARLASYPLPRLIDLHDSAHKRSLPKEKKVKKVAVVKKVAEKKAVQTTKKKGVKKKGIAKNPKR